MYDPQVIASIIQGGSTMKSMFILVLLSFISSGCTSYQSQGWTGGYSEIQLSENVYQVEFNGNGYTRASRAADFALLRSAELTLEKGYRFFAIVDSANTNVAITTTSPTTTRTDGNLSSNGQFDARTTTTGGGTSTINKPTSTNTIVLYRDMPEGILTYDAQITLNSILVKYDIDMSTLRD